jgi:hypothetical protein
VACARYWCEEKGGKACSLDDTWNESKLERERGGENGRWSRLAGLAGHLISSQPQYTKQV